jgi:hypothetical protein
MVMRESQTFRIIMHAHYVTFLPFIKIEKRIASLFGGSIMSWIFPSPKGKTFHFTSVIFHFEKFPLFIYKGFFSFVIVSSLIQEMFNSLLR